MGSLPLAHNALVIVYVYAARAAYVGTSVPRPAKGRPAKGQPAKRWPFSATMRVSIFLPKSTAFNINGF